MRDSLSKTVSKCKELLLKPSNNTFLQLIRYGFVGGISAVVDCLILFILNKIGIHYLISTAIAFVVSLLVNYFCSNAFVFNASKSKAKNKTIEFVIYLFIGLIGLLFTELLMYLFTGVIGFPVMVSKVIAMVLVLFWNFFARKFILYKKGD